MNSFKRFTLLLLASFFVAQFQIFAQNEEKISDLEKQEMTQAKEALKAASPKSSTASKKTIPSQANSFVADASWEFDGFVSGGQESNVKSMFYITDLIYINLGTEENVNPGEKLVIYKRGNKVRDPQTGKFLGYEVRRAAISEVSDRVSDKACTARIKKTYEPVEIGDLVRREE